jgi:hypothetical protein
LRHRLGTSFALVRRVARKLIYRFGLDKTEGRAEWKDLLGGKGANLAEMANMGIPVPPGFTITTEACVDYLASSAVPEGLFQSVREYMDWLEQSEDFRPEDFIRVRGADDKARLDGVIHQVLEDVAPVAVGEGDLRDDNVDGWMSLEQRSCLLAGLHGQHFDIQQL